MSKQKPRRPSKKCYDLVRKYKRTLEQSEEGSWMGSSVEIPTVFARGETVEMCLEKTLDALAIAVDRLREDGRAVPAPSSELKRDQQVNIRLTAEEKLRLEAASRNEGFRSISDFVRAIVLLGHNPFRGSNQPS